MLAEVENESFAVVLCSILRNTIGQLDANEFPDLHKLLGRIELIRFSVNFPNWDSFKEKIKWISSGRWAFLRKGMPPPDVIARHLKTEVGYRRSTYRYSIRRKFHHPVVTTPRKFERYART